MKIEVVKNAKKNIIFGALNRVVLLLCPFVERSVIQQVMGVQYLGLGGLYSSILTMLSLTELGFSSATIYNLYKPIAESDTKKVNALLNYYKKVYRIIGFLTFGIGLSLLPFLPKLIKSSYPQDINLYLLYLIYLCNSAISYFFNAYLYSVITAHQRDDINSLVNSTIKIGLTVSQILVIIFTRNYYLFAICMLISTIINNLWIGELVHKLYPQYEAEGFIDDAERKEIRKIVAGSFINQACGVTRNSLDSICISAFVGLVMAAIYDNYYVIINGITVSIGLIVNSLVGGVGNHLAIKTKDENFYEFRNLDFVYLWIGGWCTVCLLCLFQPFMKIWMGEDMLMPFYNVCLMCFYFYLLKLGDIRSMYSSALGLWWKQRNRAICETIANVTLNILLGKYFGLTGIIVATIISLFVFNYFWSTNIVFNSYFDNEKKKQYFSYQFKESLVLLIAIFVTYYCCSLLPSDSLIMFVCRMAICVVVPNLIYLLFYGRSEQFAYAIKKFLR